MCVRADLEQMRNVSRNMNLLFSNYTIVASAAVLKELENY